MKKMKKKNAIIIVCVTVIILALAVFSFKSGDNPVSNALGTVFSPVQRFAAWVYNGITDFAENVANSEDNAKENEKLRSDVAGLQDQVRMLEGYKTENDRLRQLLDFKESRTDFNTVAANVIGKNVTDTASIIAIDKGTRDGVKKNSVVLLPEGLVGIVFEAGYNFSKVRTIFDAESSVSAICLRSGDMGIVEPEGYSALGETCSVNYIDRSAKTVVGDVIETSGTGGLFPRGIKIGKITQIKEDERNLTLSATLETEIRTKNLDVVLVTVD